MSFPTACADTSLKVGIGLSHCRKTFLNHETDRWSAEPDSVITGQVDWCSTVHLDDDAIKSTPKGQPLARPRTDSVFPIRNPNGLAG